MDLNSSRPLGDQTTVIDIADRDDMDDDLLKDLIEKDALESKPFKLK